MIIDGNLLTKLIDRYQYRPVNDQLLIFAIRGALPNEALYGRFDEVTTFRSSHSVTRVKVNYQTSRCTIGLWNRERKNIALFPGSTLPCKTYLSTHKHSLETFNILCSGCYTLRKGLHPRKNVFKQHHALLMDCHALVKKPGIITTQKTIRFDWSQVKYTVQQAGDNLHAARVEPAEASSVEEGCRSMLHIPYSSSGCITIVGNPKQYTSTALVNNSWNCWQKFITYLYEASNETHFRFLLFESSDLKKGQGVSERLIRYGSQGEDVKRMQKALACIIDGKARQPYYRGIPDGIFCDETACAYLKFQQDFSKVNKGVKISVQDFFNRIKHFQFS